MNAQAADECPQVVRRLRGPQPMASFINQESRRGDAELPHPTMDHIAVCQGVELGWQGGTDAGRALERQDHHMECTWRSATRTAENEVVRLDQRFSLQPHGTEGMPSPHPWVVAALGPHPGF